jgi:hypothetical protein
MNIGILGGRDPNVRTEFTLDKHTNVAKKMFPGIVMHHRMSLLCRKHADTVLFVKGLTTQLQLGMMRMGRCTMHQEQ